MRAAIGMLLLATFPGVAFAEEPEVTNLFSAGAWVVQYVHYPGDGDTWCVAKTANHLEQVLDLTAFPDGRLTFYVFDDRWELGHRDVRFRIDIDYSRWDISGRASNNSVSVTPADSDDAIQFINELMAGSAVALYNSDNRRLGTFSLRGSSAAIRELVGCWGKITDRDPFSSDRDPFGGETNPSSDPF